MIHLCLPLKGFFSFAFSCASLSCSCASEKRGGEACHQSSGKPLMFNSLFPLHGFILCQFLQWCEGTEFPLTVSESWEPHKDFTITSSIIKNNENNEHSAAVSNLFVNVWVLKRVSCDSDRPCYASWLLRRWCLVIVQSSWKVLVHDYIRACCLLQYFPKIMLTEAFLFHLALEEFLRSLLANVKPDFMKWSFKGSSSFRRWSSEVLSQQI